MAETAPNESGRMGMAALAVGVGILASRLLGFGRAFVLSALLGVSAEASLWQYAFVIPDWMYFIMAGGYLSITLVPVLGRRLQGEDGVGNRTNAALSAVLRPVVLGLVAVTVVSIVFAGQFVALVFPRVDQQEYLTGLTRIAMASQLFFGTGTVLMAAQYSVKRFIIPTMAPLIYNLGIISGGLIGWASGNPSAASFLWGGFVGALVGNFGLQCYGAYRAGFRFIPGVPWKHTAVKEYLKTAFPLMIGISAVALDEQWLRIFGQFVSNEATSALDFARKLNMMPVGLIAQAAGVAAYPFLVTLATEGRMGELSGTVRTSARSAVAVGGLAAAFVCGTAGPLASLAYERGATDRAAAQYIASLLVVYAFSIPFWPAHQIYTRGFYAMSRMWVPVWVGSLTTLIIVPVLWALTRSFGARGVAAGSTLGIVLYTLAIAAVWHRLISPSDAASNAMFGLRVAAATVVAGVADLGVVRLLGTDHSFLVLALVSAASGLVCLAVYLGASRVLGIAETVAFVGRVTTMIRRRLVRA